MVCVALAFQGESTTDLDEAEAALRRWAAAEPAARRSVRRDTEAVRANTCDPGPDARLDPSMDVDELLAAVRDTLWEAQTLAHEDGAGPEAARCAAVAATGEAYRRADGYGRVDLDALDRQGRAALTSC